jgi:hypothetical protein
LKSYPQWLWLYGPSVELKMYIYNPKQASSLFLSKYSKQFIEQFKELLNYVTLEIDHLIH